MNIKKIFIYFVILALSSTTIASPSIPQEKIPTTFSWSGLYVGGFAGGATGAHITTTEPLRLDNHEYWFRPFHNSFSYNTSPSAQKLTIPTANPNDKGHSFFDLPPLSHLAQIIKNPPLRFLLSSIHSITKL